MAIAFREELQTVDSSLNLEANLPVCYLFKGYWIELTNQYSESKSWGILIHSNDKYRTITFFGCYSSRLEGSIMAEQYISKYHKVTLSD